MNFGFDLLFEASPSKLILLHQSFPMLLVWPYLRLRSSLNCTSRSDTLQCEIRNSDPIGVLPNREFLDFYGRYSLQRCTVMTHAQASMNLDIA